MNDTPNAGFSTLFENEAIPGHDMVVAAQYLGSIDAHLACGCLVAAGIPAVVDVNHAQEVLPPTMGPVRVLVPQDDLQRSKEVLAALARGDYSLGDDADVGPPL